MHDTTRKYKEENIKLQKENATLKKDFAQLKDVYEAAIQANRTISEQMDRMDPAEKQQLLFEKEQLAKEYHNEIDRIVERWNQDKQKDMDRIIELEKDKQALFNILLSLGEKR